MTLAVRDLLRATRGQLISGYPTSECDRVSIDTRTLRPGDIYFALKGPKFDGHDFLGVASKKRARAIVLERLDPFAHAGRAWVPDLIRVEDSLVALQDTARYIRTQATETRVIGLTGSNGKTTTKEMLAAILRLAGKTLATRGNLNNHIGLPLMLSELLPEHRFAVLEMGTSKKGDMDLLVNLAKPHVGLITNVGKDHLEFLGTPEGVLAVNRKLYDALPKDGVAVINLEDPLLKGFHGKLPCRTVSYGRLPEAEVRAIEISSTSTGLRLTLVLGKERCPVTLRAVGEVQALNALAAAAVAYALAIPAATIIQGLESFKPFAMRLEALPRADGTLVINDAYNANPSSMRASIESVCRSYPDRARWLVLGDMRELGGISRQEHEDLGRWIATQPAARVFLYGRDTRFIQQGLSECGHKGVVERYRKKRYLIDGLRNALKSDAGQGRPVVLFKASRSLKLEQVTDALLSQPS